MRVSRNALLSISLAVALGQQLVGSAASAATAGSSNISGHLIVSMYGNGTESVDASTGTVSGTIASGPEGIYSPNQQQLAYLADNGPCVPEPEGGCAWQPDLMVSSASGANPRILVHAIQGEAGPEDAFVTDPTWSPDGKQLYFDSPTGIGRINADGTGLENLVSGTDPEVSPDGSQLAFEQATLYTAPNGTNQYGEDLYLLNLATGSVRQVTTDHQLQTTRPSWSPNGQNIVYATQTGLDVANAGTGQIATLYDSGTAPVHLTSIQTPVYSPNGSQIAFSGYNTTSNTTGLYMVAADGSSLHEVAESGGIVTEWIE